MTNYFVCEQWRKRVRIHRGTCRYCNGGKGRDPDKPAVSGAWYGPFPTRAKAFEKLKQINYRDMQDCAFCMMPQSK